jgi:hypothetical protein
MEVNMKVTNYTKVNPANIKKLYENPNGNLYYAGKKEDTYQVVDGFLWWELYTPLASGRIKLIYIEGPSLGTGVEIAE